MSADHARERSARPVDCAYPDGSCSCEPDHCTFRLRPTPNPTCTVCLPYPGDPCICGWDV